MYPWSSLTEVGDYFLVLEETRAYAHMSATVSMRNLSMKGRMKYAAVRTTYGTIVMLAQVRDDLPEYDVAITEGLLARVNRVGPSPTPPLGGRPVGRELSVHEKVSRMSPEQRAANLPWWYDPMSMKLIGNGNVMREPELSQWINGTFHPHKDAPYPEHYNLDDNLMIREDSNDESESEPWENDDPPIFSTEDGDDE
jgi:hypothetical protein